MKPDFNRKLDSGSKTDAPQSDPSKPSDKPSETLSQRARKNNRSEGSDEKDDQRPPISDKSVKATPSNRNDERSAASSGKAATATSQRKEDSSTSSSRKAAKSTPSSKNNDESASSRKKFERPTGKDEKNAPSDVKSERSVVSSTQKAKTDVPSAIASASKNSIARNSQTATAMKSAPVAAARPSSTSVKSSFTNSSSQVGPDLDPNGLPICGPCAGVCNSLKTPSSTVYDGPLPTSPNGIPNVWPIAGSAKTYPQRFAAWAVSQQDSVKSNLSQKHDEKRALIEPGYFLKSHPGTYAHIYPLLSGVSFVLVTSSKTIAFPYAQKMCAEL